ncbi:MAG: hypothetical protein M1817_003581 [Caeruleum heppii]|nr:MAG: hypothetical protein M1817_003581 [Caeruleum heppii]
MNTSLINRSLGTVPASVLARSTNSQLLSSLQAAPDVHFDSRPSNLSSGSGVNKDDRGRRLHGAPRGAEEEEQGTAHRAGVNCLAGDGLDGRFLLSGGADATIHLWDLEANETSSSEITYRPVASMTKYLSPFPYHSLPSLLSSNPLTTRSSPKSHTYAITHLSFYPFDTDSFLSSSYDRTLKLTSLVHLPSSSPTRPLHPTTTFDLESPIATHAISPIASHLLVACATQGPYVRLVDLRSGVVGRGLVPPRRGAVPEGGISSVAWSPRDEHILVSGGTDGVLRIWDVRRSDAQIGVLDMEDSTACLGDDSISFPSSPSSTIRNPHSGIAHHGLINGLAFLPSDSSSSSTLISSALDTRLRIWDLSTGRNTLVNFGPSIRNPRPATSNPVVLPAEISLSGGRGSEREGGIFFHPNDKDILICAAGSGSIIRKLRPSPSHRATSHTSSTHPQRVRNPSARVNALAFRGGGHVALYAGYADGRIRAWMPRRREDEWLDGDGDGEDDEDNDGGGVGVGGEKDGGKDGEKRKRKREVMDEMYRSLMGRGLDMKS